MMTFASSSANAIGMAVGGILAVLVISAAFYLIGRGEDRERAASPADATPSETAADAAQEGRGASEPASGASSAPRRPSAPASPRRRRRP
jgi:hypothetical protein